VVLLGVVASYNPWLGIRFSTYAFTCLMRALSRLWGKISTEQKHRLLQIEQLANKNVANRREPQSRSPSLPVERFFRDDHGLLSEREKMILKRRYGLSDLPVQSTLEAVGRDLGLSKERVRQVEKAALGKLRLALGDGTALT
jgi:RNA polymerase sigma factor (sigma-70 family)